MKTLPQGVVTFVFTDIEGSTRMWDDAPEIMMDALLQHDDAIDRAVAEHDGISVKPRGEGDSRFLVFVDAVDAVCAASAFQRNLAEVEWVTPRPIKVRTSVHSGTADLQLGDYYSAAVNRAARLRAIGHGGQTLISSSTWELVQDRLPAYLTVIDMGEHALKDLTRPEHVYQLNTDGMPTDFPHLRSLDSIPNNLPQQVTDFVGRTREVENLIELLQSTRLLTILAPGGTGKTRLAIQAAADLTSEYPDGVFFVSLAEANTFGDIVQTIAESLGIAFSADEEPKKQLLTYLASRVQLLVFDNFEHVVDSATVVTEILTSTENIKVIVTSRTKLNVQGEAVMQLGGLDVTWADESEVLITSGVRLFVDAAKRSDPNFTLGSDDLVALKAILSVTGGMPLAILLAAAWVDILPIAEIAGEITKSSEILESKASDMPDRHRSIRTVFEYSWDLLTPGERSVFAALSVFRDGFTRDAADKIAGATLMDLATLAGKSLITPNTAKDRYAVHELLRQFAEEELRKGDDRFAEIQSRHAAYFADHAENGMEKFFDSDQLTALAMWAGDLENQRQAWRFALKTADAGLARQMLVALEMFYEIRGWYRVGADLWAGAIDAFSEYGEEEDVNVVRAMAMSADTYFRTLLGSPDPAPAVEGANVLRTWGNDTELWISLQAIALSTSYLGRVDEMIEATTEMSDIGETLPMGMLRVGGRNWRALAALQGGDPETARDLLPHAMEVLAQLGEHYYRSWTLVVSSMLANVDGQIDRAVDLLQQQVELCRTINYRRGMMTGLGTLGWAQIKAGRLGEAEHSFIESVAVASETGITIEVLGFMVSTAKVCAADGRHEDAVRLLASVLAEPESSKQTISDPVPVADQAREVLEEIRETMTEATFAAAELAGGQRPSKQWRSG